MAEEITWTAPEFNYTPKGPDWYWTLGIITAALVVIAFLVGNVLFAVVLIIGGLGLGYQAGNRPDIIEIVVDESGVRLKDTLYPYSSLDSFRIERNEHEQKLILKSEKTFMPYIIISINDVDPEQLRHYLLQFIPEEQHKEPTSLKIMEYLGF
jgi:hypothetical protein